MKKQSIILAVIGFSIIIAGYLAYAGIGKSNSDQPASSPVRSGQSRDNSLVVNLSVNQTPAEPKTVKIKQGQKVTVNFTSEVTDSAHLHGYDIVTPLKAGEDTTLNFTADKTGRFELELEKSERGLAVFEVYP